MRTIQRKIVGTLIFSKDECLLLGKSHKGGVYKDKWMVPGGGIEQGDTKLEAAIRETMEEVGIDISIFESELIDLVSMGQSEKVLRDTGEKVLVKMNFYDFIVRANKAAQDIPIRCEGDLR